MTATAQTPLTLDTLEQHARPSEMGPTGRTMRVAADREGAVGSGNRVGIIKAGEAVLAAPVAGHQLSAYALKTLLLLLHSAGGTAWQSGTLHRVSKGELHDLHGGHGDRIARTLKELGTTEITVSATSSRGVEADLTQPFLSTRTIERPRTRGAWVEYQFSDAFRFVLQNSDHYAEIDKMTAMSLRSVYAIKLYEVGEMFWKRTRGRAPNTWTLTVDELREQMAIAPGQYSNWTDLERRVLRDACSELEQLSPFTVNWSIERHGRKVVKVHINFTRKPGAVAAAAVQERERHSAGRVNRREQTVATIEEPAPVTADPQMTPTVRRYNKLREREARRVPEPRRTVIDEVTRRAMREIDKWPTSPGASGKASEISPFLSSLRQPDKAARSQAELFTLDDAGPMAVSSNNTGEDHD